MRSNLSARRVALLGALLAVSLVLSVAENMLGALVTEMGSALSHGAVVAREYALPLVSGVADATEVIRTGDIICVDGTTGTVAIVG